MLWLKVFSFVLWVAANMLCVWMLGFPIGVPALAIMGLIFVNTVAGAIITMDALDEL